MRVNPYEAIAARERAEQMLADKCDTTEEQKELAHAKEDLQVISNALKHLAEAGQPIPPASERRWRQAYDTIQRLMEDISLKEQMRAKFGGIVKEAVRHQNSLVLEEAVHDVVKQVMPAQSIRRQQILDAKRDLTDIALDRIAEQKDEQQEMMDTVGPAQVTSSANAFNAFRVTLREATVPVGVAATLPASAVAAVLRGEVPDATSAFDDKLLKELRDLPVHV